MSLLLFEEKKTSICPNKFAQFVIFKPLSFASRPVSRLISWYDNQVI